MSISRPLSILLLLALGFVLTASGAIAQIITVPAISNVGSGLQGGTLTATLSVSQHGGKTVHVESDNPSVVLVSPNTNTTGTASFDVFIPNGSTSVSFVVSGMEGVTGTATITVSAPGFTSGTKTATIVQPAVDVVGLATSIDTLDPADPFQVRVGLPGSGNASVNPSQSVRAGGTGFTATIVNSDATAGQLITTPVTGQTVTVSITPGNSSSAATVAAGGVAFDGLNVASTTVSASIPGFIITTAASVNVSVTQPTITFGPIANVGSGLAGSATSVTLSASEHGGVNVHIASADSTIAVVSSSFNTPGKRAIDIFIPNGSTSTSFVVSGMEGAIGASNITISAPGFTTVSHLANVQQPAYDIVSLGTTIDTLDPPDAFQVRIGLPANGLTSVNPSLNIRAGGVPLTATLQLSAGAIGDLVTTPLTGDSVVVTIPVGASSSAASVASGGVAFDGITLGSTVVTATIPGLLATTAAHQTITVTQPTISMGAIGNTGSGLQNSGNTVTLGASAHGGVTVHVESSNPSVALVAASTSAVGAASFDVFIPNGSTSLNVYISGMEGVTGSSTVTVSAPGFTSTTSTATIIQPALDIVSLGTTIDALATPDAFQVRIGLPGSGNVGVNPSENIRPGGATLTATVKHSNHPVGDLVTTPLTGDSVVVSITPGNASSPASVATGGVAFDGIALGTTTVSATIPGFIATTNASQNISVTQPVITVSAIGSVGAGLQGSNNNASLSISNHGGVTVHVASSNPSVALVSPNASTAGAASVDINVPNNSASVVFVVSGMENVTGSSTITLSSNGFISGSQPVNIVQSAVDISSLGSAFDISDPNDPFVVRVGLPSGGNTSINPTQLVRAGSPGLTATLILSNGAVGQLVKTSTANDTVTVSIPAGQSNSAATVAAGGVAFDPLAVGTTLITATIPGFLSVGTATQQLVVSSHVVTMAGIDNIGAGLQTGPVTATLGLAQHGGVTVHLVSSDPSIALVSPNFSTPGSPSLDFPLSNGSTQVSFFVQGVATGSSTITASVPTFTSGVGTADVVQPALQVALLADTLIDDGANDPFVVQVGTPAGGNGSVGTAQFVRAGGTALTATLVCTDVTLAALVTNSQNGSPVTVSIPVGQSQSAADASLGGVELDPLLPGGVTISAIIPGFIATTAAAHAAYVKPHLLPTAVGGTPQVFALRQNIPNPFNPLTTIRYDVPRGGAGVSLVIYDLAGRRVRELVHERRAAGAWSVQWNGEDERGTRVASGIYFYRMRAGTFVATRKMVLLK